MDETQKLQLIMLRLKGNKLKLSQHQHDTINDWKKNSLSFGLVTGLFETLHLGHLRLIFFAKDNIDRLIIVGKRGNALSRLNNKTNICDLYIDSEEFDEDMIEDCIKPDKIFKGEEWVYIDKFSRKKTQKLKKNLVFVSDEDQGRIYDNSIFDLFGKYRNFFLEEFIRRHKIKKNEITKLILDLKKISVIIYGDCIIDEYKELKLLGNSQEDGLPVYSTTYDKKTLGGCLLPAKIVKNLGAGCIVLSGYQETKLLNVSSDEYNIKFKINNLDLVEKINIPTKIRYTFNGNKIFRLSQIDRPSFSTHDIASEVLHAFKSNPSNVVLLFDFGLGMIPNSVAKLIMSNLKNEDCLIGVDSQTSSVKGDLKKFIGANIMAPTELELRDGIADHHSGLKVLMEKGIEFLECEHLITTLSENGVMIMSRQDFLENDQLFMDFIPALADKVVNVSGAGDIFLTIASMALKGGASIWQAGLVGSIAASIRVETGTEELISIQNMIAKLEKIFNKLDMHESYDE